MKKVLYSFVLTLFMLFPISVLAEGYISVSPSSLTIEQGSSKTFTISAYNTIGDVTIHSNNSGIASVNTNGWATGMVDEKQTKTGLITVKGISVGTTTITLVLDAATFDSEDLSGQTKTVTVNVIAKSTPTPQPTPSPSPNNNNNTNNKLSTNNKLKSISVKGHELVKKDNNNYTLTVNNNVASINLNAVAEDVKAKVSGVGEHKLVVGDNNIEVIVTSESGSKNKINIKVTRKDGYYLEDLNSVLNDSKVQTPNIIIDDKSKISSKDINDIKNSGKIVTLNYYDKNKKLSYSWILDGTKIKDINEFVTSISYFSEYTKEIYTQSNYADGLNISFNHSGDLPKGTKIRLFVGEKFTDNSLVNIYYYDKDKNVLENIQNGLVVEEGYIEFELKHCSDYFVTMSNISNSIKKESFSIDIFIIISIIELIIIVSLVLIYYLKIKPSIKKLPTIDDFIIDVDSNVDEEPTQY